MTTTKSLSSYWAEYEILDRALKAKNGIRLQFDTVGDAYQLRTRLHYARQLDRVLDTEVRELSDPKSGVSEYDKLVVKVRKAQDKWWVRIVRAKLPEVIEEIEDDEQREGKAKPVNSNNVPYRRPVTLNRD